MATKYPIILAHGIFMKPRFFRVFKHIKRKLKKAGYSVYIADTDGVGTLENNALMLKEQIEKILDAENAEKINIIAHSKGGLESIYMIKNLNMAGKVASLTTLCTPYKGSAVASFVNSLPTFLLNIFVCFCNLFYKILGDKKPDSRTALKGLDTRFIPETTELDSSLSIYFQSYSCSMKRAISDPVLSIPFLISTKREKDLSDGMVSQGSARFANYKGDCIDESISHNEIVCYMTRPKKKAKVVNFYITLCETLARNGY